MIFDSVSLWDRLGELSIPRKTPSLPLCVVYLLGSLAKT